jgi:MFS transporter, MHS family, proline/betaine transporter
VAVPAYLAEQFPTPGRSTALAITYGLGSALFGGTAPLLATLLVRWTGNPVLPAVYAIVVAAVASRETAFQPLDEADGIIPSGRCAEADARLP